MSISNGELEDLFRNRISRHLKADPSYRRASFLAKVCAALVVLSIGYFILGFKIYEDYSLAWLGPIFSLLLSSIALALSVRKMGQVTDQSVLSAIAPSPKTSR